MLAGPIQVTASMISFAVRATVTRADIPALCADLAELLCGRDPGVVVCDVAAVVQADVVMVEALARLRLAAARQGWRLAVDGAGPELRRLIGLLGLAGVLPESVGQPEEGEQAGRVEEVVERRDPAVRQLQHDE